ncbi:MAG: hypothetical protein ABIH24_05810, partial [Verrucomicrobiota bacterium]
VDELVCRFFLHDGWHNITSLFGINYTTNGRGINLFFIVFLFFSRRTTALWLRRVSADSQQCVVLYSLYFSVRLAGRDALFRGRLKPAT